MIYILNGHIHRDRTQSGGYQGLDVGKQATKLMDIEFPFGEIKIFWNSTEVISLQRCTKWH